LLRRKAQPWASLIDAATGFPYSSAHHLVMRHRKPEKEEKKEKLKKREEIDAARKKRRAGKDQTRERRKG
jgi:hypothetical protein